jgi:hypothetical protein
MFRVCCALILLTALMMPSVAVAQQPALSIPQVELNGVAAELGQLLGRLLREEVERLGRFRSTGTPRLALRDLMSAVDCANDSPACLAAVGRALKVQKLVLSKLDRVGDRFLVTLQLFDVPGEHIDLRLQKGLVGRDALVAEFPRLVRRFLGLKESEAGSLQVTANEPDVQVLIDGVEQGAAPLTIERLAIGEYKVEARKPGFPLYVSTVQVKQNQLSQLAVVMGAQLATPLPPPGGAPPPPSGRSIKQIRWYTWALLGAGAGGLIAGGALGGVVLSKQNDFNGQFPSSGRPTGAMYATAQGLASDGKNLALGSNIAFGVGGGVMVAGVILLVRDLLRPAGAEVQRSAAPACDGCTTRKAGLEVEARSFASSGATIDLRPFASFGAGVMAGLQVRY